MRIRSLASVSSIALCFAAVAAPRGAAATECDDPCYALLCDHQDSDRPWAVGEGTVIASGTDASAWEHDVERTAVHGPLAEAIETGGESRHRVYLPLSGDETLEVGERLVLVFQSHPNGTPYVSRAFRVDAEDRVVCPTDDSVRTDRERALRIMQRDDCVEAAVDAGWDDLDCGCGCSSGGEATGSALAVGIALAALRWRRPSSSPA